MVDEYKNTNSHILKQCMRISEMLLINIPVGKLFEGLDFANEQVESLLLLLPLVVAASTIFGSLLLLCIICVFSCLWPQGLLLMKGGRRISDVCNSLVHAVHVKVSLALASLDERWLRRTEKWFSFFFCRQELNPCPLDLQSSVVAKWPQGPIRLVGQPLKTEYGCPSGQEDENGHTQFVSPKTSVLPSV